MVICKHNIDINAPIQLVWEILTDFERYPHWNPLIGNLKGTLVEQNFLLIYLNPLNIYVPVQLVQYNAPSLIVWKATLPARSVLQGEHFYKLQAINSKQTKLEHGEIFSGKLASMLPNRLISYLQDAFQYHNQKLKIIVENTYENRLK